MVNIDMCIIFHIAIIYYTACRGSSRSSGSSGNSGSVFTHIMCWDGHLQWCWGGCGLLVVELVWFCVFVFLVLCSPSTWKPTDETE